MRFSILVPIYNAEDYLDELFESFDSQDFRDFEVVLIDDGSTDKSPAACDSYAASHPGTVVIHRPNAGRFSARVQAVSEASGDYLIFADADDRLKSYALSAVSEVIGRTGADMVLYNAEIFDENGTAPFFEHVLKEGVVADKNLIYDKLFFEYSLNSMCLRAAKRELFFPEKDYSAFYDCTVAEDLLQSVPLFMRAGTIYYLDRSLYEYRTTSGSTHRFNLQYYWNNKKINIEIRKELEDAGIPDLEEKAAFHILIAAYAGTTQLKFSDSFDDNLLERITSDEEFQAAWKLAWNGKFADRLNKKQKLILKLLHGKNFAAIRVLLALKGGK